MDDQLYQALIDAGVSPEIKNGDQLYRQCPGCRTLFTTNYKPNLLSCGHFICDDVECKQPKKCLVCYKPLEIKKKDFTGLLNLTQLTQINSILGNNYFNFAIRVGLNTHEQEVLNDISSNTKVFKLVQQSHKLKNYVDTLGQEKVALSFGSKSLMYQKIKEKKLSELNLTLYPSQTGRHNQIQASNRFIGGNGQQKLDLLN